MRASLKGVFVIHLTILLCAAAAYAEAPPKMAAMRETDNITVDEKGDAAYTAKVVFPSEDMFLKIRKGYPDPKIILRNTIGPLSRFAFDNTKIDYRDETTSLQVSAEILGASVTDKNGRWGLYVGEHYDLIFSDPTDSKYVLAGQSDNDGTLLINNTVVELPHGATNITMNGNSGVLEYDLDRTPKKGSASLDVNLKAKPRVMSAVYKVFANPDFEDGTFWLGKTVFHNTGDGDITHLKVSYRISGYADWCPSRDYGLVAAGGHVVSCYYPVLSKDMAMLNSATPADVEVKYSYIDSAGQTHEDSASARTTLLSSHAVEYSNLAPEDRTEAWSDIFSNVLLIAAFVNRNDDPVRKFEGMVAQACGGVPGGENDDSTKKFCQTLYDMMVANGMSYVLSTEYFVNYTEGQEIKYPRDVLRDKSGTCIELAIFYAAVCESASIKCHLVVIPGHCFPVVVLPSGNLMPIEATAISGAALPKEWAKGRKTLPFYSDDAGPGAVECAIFEYTNQRRPGWYSEIDVDDVQLQGVVCPELAPVGDDFLSQYKVYDETGHQPPAPAKDPQGGGDSSNNTAIDLSGHFAGQFTNNKSGKTGDIAFDITQDAEKISAKVTLSTGEATLEGAMSGHDFSLEGHIASGVVIRMKAQTDGQTIKGQFANSAGGAGTFTATRAGS